MNPSSAADPDPLIRTGVNNTSLTGTRSLPLAGVFTAAGTNPFGAFAGNPYGGAFAGNPYGGVFAGNPYGGVFAGNPFLSGFGFGSSGVSRAPVYPAFPDPFVPFVIPTFQFPEFKNWYEGENVCKEEKLMNTQLPDDVIPDDWKDDMPNVNTDFSHEQESCKGTDKKYVCVKRYSEKFYFVLYKHLKTSFTKS
ncbi:hypothetical protein AVEN_2602-1 [Araneus ventricosus]|uniref:Uncharacterized protein n=1 Tax=Araneus ventricosus TaxID=182803 RepID=A0A4Y2V357_ARAVE|nr:hypothetical protein AVEN_2602-1 [Araneus ventricosus]